MKFPRYQLAHVLAKRSMVSSGSTQVKPFAEEVAAYLLDEGRTGELDSLLRDMIEYRAERGIVEVQAISAHELSNTLRHDIETRVRSYYPNAKQIIITEIHDDSVIGGIRLELANQQLDLSIQSKLSRFKQLTTAGRN